MVVSKSDKNKIINRLKELEILINKHNYLYHTKDQPKINDSEYDKLVKENLKLETEFPELKLKTSTSDKVGL